MRQFKVEFYGRKAGSIGIVYRICDTVKAFDKSEVRSVLYEKYEHITELKISEVK